MGMEYVLGVDAAWTSTEPSGVALLKCDSLNNIEIIRVGRSYEEFCHGKLEWDQTVTGSPPDFLKLIKSCRNDNINVQVIALDIHLSPVDIVGRRGAENKISSVYGKYGAATHSPTPKRPGKIASTVFQQLEELGFNWKVERINAPTFIEVYPHVAIIELLGYDYRLPYKIQKKNKYWADIPASQRLPKAISKLNELKDKIALKINNVHDFVPHLDPDHVYPIKFLKGYEDVLDALICGLVGCYYIDNKVNSFGDEAGMIWVPRKI